MLSNSVSGPHTTGKRHVLSTVPGAVVGGRGAFDDTPFLTAVRAPVAVGLGLAHAAAPSGITMRP